MPVDRIPPAPPGNPPAAQNFYQRLRHGLRQAWSRHQRRYRSKNRPGYRTLTLVSVLAALGLAAGGAIWLEHHPYRHFKERRAAQLARSFLEKGDLSNAGIRARQALLLNPNDLTACEVMARLAGQAHSPDELAWRQRVAVLEPTLENKLLLAEAGLHYQKPPFPVTSEVMGGLTDIGATNARYQNIAAQLAIVQRQIPEAEANFAAAAALDPTNAHYALNLALFRLALTNELERVKSRECLRQLRADPVYGADALRGLVKDRLAQKDPKGASEYSTQLLAQPQASLSDRLQNLDVLRLQNNPSLTSRLRALQQSAQTSAPMAIEISGWMLANGHAGDVLTWLASLPPQIQNQPPLLAMQADAYQENGDWPGLRDLTAQGNWGELEYLRYAALAHAAAQLGHADAARNNWNSAVDDKTADNRPAMEKLLKLAAQWHLETEEADLLERVIRSFPEVYGDVLALTQLYARTGNTSALHRLYGWLTTAFPDEPDYQLGLAATSLLLQTNLPAAEQWTAAAYWKTPENPGIVTAYACARYLEHKDDDGIAALQKLPPDQLAQPSCALYYGVLLAASGRAVEAAPWLERARSGEGAFLPEEKQLLDSALGRK